MRTAKILCPELINTGFNEKTFTIFFDKYAIGLKREKLPARSAKSENRNKIGNIFPVRIKTERNNIVKAPFKRATCSSIFLLEMGQKAVDFIICFIKILCYKDIARFYIVKYH